MRTEVCFYSAGLYSQVDQKILLLIVPKENNFEIKVSKWDFSKKAVSKVLAS